MTARPWFTKKAHNAKLQLGSEAEFIEQVLTGLTPEPRYYPRMKRLNARGPEPLGPRPHLSALSPEQMDDLRQRDERFGEYESVADGGLRRGEGVVAG